MQFRTNNQWSSITLLFIKILLSSLSLTLPLVGLYLYPYWTGKLDSKFFFLFLEKKTNKAVFLPGRKFCGNLLKQKFPSFSLVTRILFSSTKVYQRHIRQDRRSGTTKRIISTEICSRGLGYVPSRLDRRAYETVYREMRKCSQDLFTHVSVAQLLV